jgi:predicted SAM-dependent methyltransferase
VEHLDFIDDIPRVFAEFHRVLEAGGAVRIIVPDAERFLRAYASGEAAAWRELGLDLDHLPPGMTTPMVMLNHVFHQGGEHYFGWDFTTMESALRQAGFAQVIRQRFGVSIDPELAIDQPNHAPYSLYVDAVK